jgi:hypothetical protein
MNRKSCMAVTTTFGLLLFTPQLFFGSSVLAQRRIPRASSFRREQNPNVMLANRLFITVSGAERKITDQALDAWLIDDGRSVVYSWLDGSGGFENEGQSLRIYDVRRDTTRKILSEYVGVVALMPVKVSNGKLALLVKMGDGGLGASYFAVVDPRRGEVFYRRWAELTDIRGDRIKLAFYDPDDWDEILESRSGEPDDPNRVISHTKVKHKRVETHYLKRILEMRTIHNKRRPQ